MKLFFLGGWLTASLWTPAIATAEVSGESFFENHIRPTLIESCLDCHGPEKQNSGLRLDTLAGWLKGSDYHPVVVPGRPEDSRLMEAIRHSGDLKMPDKGKKLSEETIAHFEEWIRMGLPWPESPEIASTAAQDPKDHWAFQPIKRPPLPEDLAAGDTAVDAFVTAAQREHGLTRNPVAARSVLIRRLYLDLLGFPPTAEQVNAFVEDVSPNAYEQLVDSLLSSPHYGERWGRYWLDVARYADSKGYVFEEERRYPYAFTYRDWVVDSFNTDLPYEQFIVQQIAGDHVATEEDPTPMAGLGFLTLGRRFLNQQPDIIDDRIDVVTRGTMGLTVACARCHDHKFDPIPTADYYSLYGVFASSEEPKELPLLGEPDDTPAFRAFTSELENRESKLKDFFNEKHAALRNEETLRNYLTLAFEGWSWDDNEFSSQAQKRELYQEIAHRWRRYLKQAIEEGNPVFQPWSAFATLEPDRFEAECSPILENITATAHPGLIQILHQERPASMADVIAVYARELAEVNRAEAFSDSDQESLRQVLVDSKSPTGLDPEELYRIFNTPDQQHVRKLRREIEEHKALSPGAPPRAMAMQDRQNPVEPNIFIRGNARRPGDQVPRQFLEILSGAERKPFSEGSGRLEMAKEIASAENPLTARVFVNRIWDHHFGDSLVDSPSDFGVRTPKPILSDLLDYLASEFIESGWSVKQLHRMMLLSQVYRQTSDIHAEGEQADPTNSLYWRMNRRRLDLEAFRDSILYVSERLDLKMGGRAVDIVEDPSNSRRSLYGFIDRQNLPSLFRTFDFASPDAHSPQRFETTVPQQALFMMNSPFIKLQIDALVAHPEHASALETGIEEGVRRFYEQILSRSPSPEEEALGVSFIQEGDSSSETWASLAQVLLSSNEFIFID